MRFKRNNNEHHVELVNSESHTDRKSKEFFCYSEEYREQRRILFSVNIQLQFTHCEPFHWFDSLSESSRSALSLLPSGVSCFNRLLTILEKQSARTKRMTQSFSFYTISKSNILYYELTEKNTSSSVVSYQKIFYRYYVRYRTIFQFSVEFDSWVEISFSFPLYTN